MRTCADTRRSLPPAETTDRRRRDPGSVLTTPPRRNTPLHFRPYCPLSAALTPDGDWSQHPLSYSQQTWHTFVPVPRISRRRIRWILIALIVVVAGAAGLVWANSGGEAPRVDTQEVVIGVM